MKRLVLLTITVFIFLTLFLAINSNAAIMEDYCQVPPYVIQNVAPNVMIVLDNSGSMLRFSYYDGFTTPAIIGDDNYCTNSVTPCTGFSEPGPYPPSCAEYVANPDNYYKYYGYYNPDYWYTYSSNRFVPTAPKTGSCVPGARAKAGDEWDGNFLNWLTMRRVDVIRKVMTGGTTTSGEGSGYNRLIGEVADCDSRGRFKSISSADLYMPYSGTRKFVVNTLGRASCDGGGSGTSSFTVRNATDTGNEATFNVAVRVPVPVEGVLQSVVGARARLGLSFYRVNTDSSNQGGFVQVYISGGSLSSTVNQINLTRPNANTPLSETLWTMAGYFAQTDSISGIGSPGPRYSSGDYQINNNVDPLNYGTGGQPRYPSCAKSFVLYITDGEPCADGNLPANLRDYANGRSNFNCSGTGCPAKSGTAPETYTFPAATFTSCTGENNSAFCDGVTSGCYVAGIEDVALYAHTTDLRSATIGKNDMPGNQVLTLYTVFAWGTGSTLLKYATINGSFEDINGNNIPDLQSEWDENGDGVPDTYFEARDGSKIEKAVKEAFMSMIKRASSGTAASVLASGEGQGANLVQAVFFPRRRIGNDVIAWAGALQNLWYYVDPYFTKSDIREDSVYDQKLHLIEDYITRLYFDTTFQTVRARLCSDSDGDGD
ncbi:MAG: hypothetical protein OEZ31_11350, partial [Nitrospirota bacterium]|nr:hypothetical protein [Nitrospirota bacterium]